MCGFFLSINCLKQPLLSTPTRARRPKYLSTKLQYQYE
jgi:hypothetical protein